MKFLFICLSMLTWFFTHAQHDHFSSQYKIDSLFKNYYKDDHPGASIMIERNGKTFFKASYGVANMESPKKINSATNFNIGSITKQFTAMGILRLAEERKLSLNDKLSKFFPELNKKVADVITIQQLLTHSSGIVEHYVYTDTNKVKHAHIADVLNAIRNIDSTYFLPGSAYRYSNTGYCLLALIIAKVSGLSYSAYMKKEFFVPLGMSTTTIWNENERIPNRAIGYEFDKITGTFKRSDAQQNIFFSTEGDGGIYTSIDDYIKWVHALQAGSIIARPTVDLARSAHFVVDKSKNLSYGFGWFIQQDSSVKQVYHSGSNGGFRAFCYTIPQEGYVIVIFSNRTGVDLEDVIREINKILRQAN